MKTPTTKSEAMNEARQAKERAAICTQHANDKRRRPAQQRIALRALAETNRKMHSDFIALAATLPE